MNRTRQADLGTPLPAIGKTVNVEIDGQAVTVDAGSSILRARLPLTDRLRAETDTGHVGRHAAVRQRHGRGCHRYYRCQPDGRSPGIRIPNMFDAACDGTFKAMYIQGEDLAQSDPNTLHPRRR